MGSGTHVRALEGRSYPIHTVVIDAQGSPAPAGRAQRSALSLRDA